MKTWTLNVSRGKIPSFSTDRNVRRYLFLNLCVVTISLQTADEEVLLQNRIKADWKGFFFSYAELTVQTYRLADCCSLQWTNKVAHATGCRNCKREPAASCPSDVEYWFAAHRKQLLFTGGNSNTPSTLTLHITGLCYVYNYTFVSLSSRWAPYSAQTFTFEPKRYQIGLIT
jgi:hypothetical protein